MIILVIVCFALDYYTRLYVRVTIAALYCKSLEEWIDENYLPSGDKYYRIHPPNRFDTYRQVKRAYKRYINKVVRQKLNAVL